MRQWFLHPRSVVLIVAVAIALRLAVGAWFQTHLPVGKQFEFGDSDGYWYLGQQIAAGRPYQYRSDDDRVFRMPGYPAALAPIFLVFGHGASPLLGRALSAVLGGVTAALMVWWGTLLFDLRAGLIAGWITAFYPGAIAMGSFVLSEAPFMPLTVANLALWAAAWKAATTRATALMLIAAGLAAAAAIYMRPSWLLFTPFAAVMGVILSRNRLTILWQCAAIAAVIAVCLTPWWIRNYRTCGHFVPTTLQVGVSLYDGLNSRASGGSELETCQTDLIEFIRQNNPEDIMKYFPPSGLTFAGPDFREFELDAMYRHMALQWASRNPLRVIHLAGIKFSRMWNIIPNEPMFRSWPVKLCVALTFTPIFILGLYGAMRFNRLGWPYLLASLPVLYFTLLHVIFVASIRYREPAMLGLIVLASGVIAGWKDLSAKMPQTGPKPSISS